MKKILELLFGPNTIFSIFTVAIIMTLVTAIELKVFQIPDKYADRILLSNIILTFGVYFASCMKQK